MPPQSWHPHMYLFFSGFFCLYPLICLSICWFHIVSMIIFDNLYLIGLVLPTLLVFSEVSWLFLFLKFSILKVFGRSIMNLTSVLRISILLSLIVESEGWFRDLLPNCILLVKIFKYICLYKQINIITWTCYW